MRRIAMPDEGIETLFGPLDENLRHLESALGVRLRTSGHDVVVEGDAEEVGRAERVFAQLAALLREGYRFAQQRRQLAEHLLGAADFLGVAFDDHVMSAGLQADAQRRFQMPQVFV